MLPFRFWCVLFGLIGFVASSVMGEDITLKLRSVKETEGRWERQLREESWNPKVTAVIVCDAWDSHHCLNAVRRLEEFAPRINAVVNAARERGAIIIHAPSDCMASYGEHPARLRAMAVPLSKSLPPEISNWCKRIPAEDQAEYPIDQTDGGEDDDPAEHAAWAEQLKSMGRNPRAPWKKQIDMIAIDSERDFISDKGPEIWSLLEQRGIKTVMLTGVHTNMCVLGRPFGLRQMVRNGKQAILIRDLTDCMYNPQRHPFVNHFTGNDLIIAYIERCICPTITSDQILGGQPFRSKTDQREQRDILSLAEVKSAVENK